MRGHRYRHGHSKKPGSPQSKTYGAWCSMLWRCNNPKCPAYPKYGGIGIRVCKRWLDFKNFLEDMGEVPPGMSLDRHPSSSKIYSKRVCRWATREQQSVNRRGKRFPGRTSQFKGVVYNKQRRRWQATILNRYLGVFDEEAAAARVYDKNAFEAWGADAYLNFPKKTKRAQV